MPSILGQSGKLEFFRCFSHTSAFPLWKVYIYFIKLMIKRARLWVIIIQFCKYVSLCTRGITDNWKSKKNAQCQCIWTLFLFSYFFEKLLFHNIFNLTRRIESRKWQYDFIVRSLKNRFWNPPFNKIHQAYLFCILLREVRFIIPAWKRNLFQPSS